MMQNKFILGITGGSGTGKSTVSEILRGLGVEVVDCDLVARAVTEKDTPCLAELEAEFGSSIIGKDGSLLRRTLGEIVFQNSQKLKKLNEITHRYITDEVMKRLEKASGKIGGIDGAVLFESGITDRCNAVIGVLAARPVRIVRITKRDGISRQSAENRIDSQKNDEFYLENCDIILYNNGSKQELEFKVKEVVSKLEKQIYGKSTVSDVKEDGKQE